MNVESLLHALDSSRRTIMQQRFAEQWPQLEACLQRLYGDNAEYSRFSRDLVEVIFAANHARTEALVQLDALRLQQADWFCSERMLGYCAYVDRFCGNLRGLGRRITHLQNLGVSYLHLLPFLKARQGENDGGFAVASFEEIQAEFGDSNDLQNLTRRLREAGISLCSDLVLNHVADDHPWALAAKSGDPYYQAFFHAFEDRVLPDQYEQTVGQVFPQAAPGNFTFDASLQKWVWTTFYPFQWDLNYTNPQVFLQMVKALLNLANWGVEVFRLDSTAFLWKRLGTNCMNQAEAHWILQALRCIAQIAAPAVVLKAEAIVPTADLPAYLGDETQHIKECQIAYHSSLMAAAWMALSEQKTEVLQCVIQRTPVLPAQASWLTYVRCHDDIGWNVLRAELAAVSASAKESQQRLQSVSSFYSGQGAGFADGLRFQASDPQAVHGTVGMTASLCGVRGTELASNQMAVRRICLMYALAMSVGGLPLLYMGDEFGQTNDRSYLDDVDRSHDGRWLQRPMFDLRAMSKVQQADQTSVAFAVYSGVQRLLEGRRQLPAFAARSSRRLLQLPQASVLAFVRGECELDSTATVSVKPVLCLFNFSENGLVLEWDQLVQLLGVQSSLASQQEFQVLSADGDSVFNAEHAGKLVLKAYATLWLT